MSCTFWSRRRRKMVDPRLNRPTPRVTKPIERARWAPTSRPAQGIDTIGNYGLPDALKCHDDLVAALASMRTRLNRVDQEHLINWATHGAMPPCGGMRPC